MKNENYITIQGWMINELKLKGNELILFAIIYGFSQDGQSEYYGSQRYIAKAMKVSLPTANKLINKLLLKKLIHQTSESHYKVLKKVKQGVKESLTVSVKESLTNNYNTNNKNNIVEASSTKEKIDDKEIKMDIKDFEVYCKKSPHKHIHFIADWARATKPNCDNLAEWKVYIKRNLKASIQTVKFSDDKIKTAFKKMKDASETLNFTPTIETLNKYLTK